MKHIVLAVVLLAAFADARQAGLKVRFDMGDNMGVDYFISLPKTVIEAERAAWVLTERPPGPMPSLFMYCFPDRVICVLFDDTNRIAGLQVAIPLSQFSHNAYDMETTGFTLWTPSVPFWETSQSYWAIQQYFVNEEILRQPKEVRLARNVDQIVRNGGVWVTGVGKQLLRIADNTAEIDDSVFKLQACTPWMGQHYYHNMTTTTECDVPLYPWFAMTDGDDLVATGFVALGRLDKPDIAKSWFETPAAELVKAIVPYSPDCLFKLTQDPGALTLHIYYVEEPWTIMC